MNKIAKLLLALLSTFMFSNCAGNLGGGKISPQQENALGEQQARQVLSKVRLSRNPRMNRAVKNAGARIARVANRPDFKWRYYLVDNPKVANAFVLPGGKVFVYTGLFKYVSNEAELASVIGHEVTHALKSHGVKGAQRKQNAGLLGMVLNVGMGVAGVNRQTAQQVNKVYGQGATLGYIRPYSRQNETEADSIGLMLMARAGYDPRAALSFWNKFAKQGQRVPEYMSTHPSSAHRIQNLRALMPRALALYNKRRRR